VLEFFFDGSGGEFPCCLQFRERIAGIGALFLGAEQVSVLVRGLMKKREQGTFRVAEQSFRRPTVAE